MKVVNIVLNGKFSKSLDLRSIRHCTYRPERFSGGVYEHNGHTFLLFVNGSFVCLGGVKKCLARRSIYSLAEFLNVRVLCCCTKNMVMSHKLGYLLDLPKLYEYLKRTTNYITYEDELFSGITWKESGGTVRLFHTGSFFVTGLCKKKDLKRVCRYVCTLCRKHKK